METSWISIGILHSSTGPIDPVCAQQVRQSAPVHFGLEWNTKKLSELLALDKVHLVPIVELLREKVRLDIVQ